MPMIHYDNGGTGNIPIPVAPGTPLPIWDQNLEIVKGGIPGKSTASVLGLNPTVGSASFEDVWDPGGVLIYPTAGETWELVSSSINDDVGGTGATSVLVQYLDEDYVEQTETVATDGVTPVTFSAINAFRFKRAIVLTAGSGNINAGNITIRVSGAGAIRGQINTDFGNSLDGHYTVPAGCTAYLKFVFSNINKNEDAEMKLLSTTGTGGVFTHRFFLSVFQNSVVGNFPFPAMFTEKSDLKLQAKSSDVSAKAVAALQFEVHNESITSAALPIIGGF